MNCLKLIVALNMIICSAYGMGNEAWYDSELSTIKCARDSSRKGIRGFQGCANQKKCGFDGFYLAQYSPEGLCNDCEFEQYPERFVACAFCRAPQKKLTAGKLSIFYDGCDSFIQDILVRSTKLNNDGVVNERLRMGAFISLGESNYKIGRKYINDFGKGKVRFAARSAAREQRRASNKNLEDRLGIYLGALILANGNKLHAWTDRLSIDPLDKKLVATQDDAKKHLEYICEKYNVFGPETGEITLQSIPDGAVTFEEVLSHS
jgi:hypothetical protein